MSSDSRTTFKTNLADLKQLFGPPPVLSSENEKDYDEICARLMQCFRPKDFIEQLLIRQVADCTWEMIRYMRHKTLSIERKFQQDRESEARLIKLRAERKPALVRGATAKAGAPATELDRIEGLEEVVEQSVADIDGILTRPPDELNHARALEVGIEYHGKLDDLLSRTVLRRNDALRQIEKYREGLGRHLLLVSDAMLDALCEGELQVAAS